MKKMQNSYDVKNIKNILIQFILGIKIRYKHCNNYNIIFKLSLYIYMSFKLHIVYIL